MSKLDDLYRLHRLLDGRRTAINRQTLLDELQFSRSKLTRVIADLRKHFDAPLVFDQEYGGYRFDTADGRFELPGLWFTGEELHALVSLDHLLRTLQPGLLDQLLAPIRARLERIHQAEHLGGGEAQKRIRILAMAGRAKNMRHFQTAAGAVLQRRRLSIEYYNRERDRTDVREISPQRLTHYRDNWYLDAWCHRKKALRIFALECIRHASVSTKTARNVPEATLDRELASAYGIFAGEPVATAVLRFSAHRARWVADETWHPEQQARWLEDGRYELRLPYSRDTELVMDILKHGAEVEVVAPEALREAVIKQLDQARSRYG